MKPMQRRAAEVRGELWRAFLATRSEEERNRIVESYVPYVRALAARLAQRLPPQVDLEDLQSAGMIGLVRAVEHFDPTRGARFETYCRKRVTGAMIDELRRQDWIPREARDRAEHLHAARERLAARLGREPSEREIAIELKVTPAALHALVLDAEFAAQVPLEFADDDGSWPSGHRAEPVGAAPEPADEACRREILELVERAMSSREKEIVRSYYHEEQPMRRIGDRLHLSESRVCQMHHRMLERLKERLYQKVAP